MSEDRLQWYYKRRPEVITSLLYQAGQELQKQWEVTFGSDCFAKTNLRAPQTFSKQPPIPLGFRKAEQLQKLRASLNFVGGPELAKILIEVVCKGNSMDWFERRLNWRKGSGLVVLRTALYRLALHQQLLNDRSCAI